MCTFEPITIRKVAAQSLSSFASMKMTASRGRLTVSQTMLSPCAGRSHLGQLDVARLDFEPYDKASEQMSRSRHHRDFTSESSGTESSG
jgi:hypothetical protein